MILASISALLTDNRLAVYELYGSFSLPIAWTEKNKLSKCSRNSPYHLTRTKGIAGSRQVVDIMIARLDIAVIDGDFSLEAIVRLIRH